MRISSIVFQKCDPWGNRFSRWFILISVALLFFLINGPRPAAAGEPLTGILEGIRNNYAGLEGLTVPYERDVVTQSMAMLD